MSDLRLDWCSHEAAKYAVNHWHYSKSLPSGKSAYVGVWEHGKFIGCIIYSRGTCRYIAAPFGLEINQTCELARIALRNHDAPVSKMIAISLRMLHKNWPGIKIVVSYADPQQGHHGGIYQASNWVYTGTSNAQVSTLLIGNKKIHKRSVFAKYGTANPAQLAAITGEEVRNGEVYAKHKYIYPLYPKEKDMALKLSKPYPKHAPEA